MIVHLLCISAFVLYCKRKLHINFHKKILIFKPPGIFWKWKLWRACAGAQAPKFWIWTSKIMPDLWLVDLFCPIKKKFHTPPYYAISFFVWIRIYKRVQSTIYNGIWMSTGTRTCMCKNLSTNMSINKNTSKSNMYMY